MEQVRLAELCAATSLITDMGTGQPDAHGLRTCLVAMRLADGLSLESGVRGELFYVSLLRFLGCTADAHQVAAMAGGDEMRFLSGMAPVTMGSPREEIRQMIGLVAEGQRVPQRLRALARVLTDPKGKQRLFHAHCEVAARLAVEMGVQGRVGDALAVAYARWDGQGVPADVGETDIPMSVRVSIVARDLELWARETSDDATCRMLARRRGRAYDPEVVDAALDIGVEALRGSADNLWEQVLALEPHPRATMVGEALDRALGALGDFADLKLPERTGYARRVARLVSAAAEIANLDRADSETAVRAALVHDVGVVAVPAHVWRQSPTTPGAVWEQVRLHPYWSQRTLSRCPALEAVARVAGRHHERIDASGYPAGLDGDLGRPAGLLASAVAFDELRSRSDDRRDTADAADAMMSLVARGALDRGDVAAVLGAAGASVPLVEVPRPAGLTEREVEVLGLLAHGDTNREIAEALGISVKTVGAHVEHIYTKAGVRSRAAATLFAMQHDLVR